MWPFSQWTTAGRAALIYITLGAFTVIWAGVWYVYLFNNPPAQGAYYWCTGFLVTGFTMVLIGLVLGKISRSTQMMEPPSVGVALTAANLQPNAPPTPSPVLSSLTLATPVVSQNGQAVQHAAPQEPLAGVAGLNQ